MKAVKSNRVYTITEIEAQSFINEGFDVLHDDGSVYAYGKGKTVPFGQYMEEKEAMQKRIDELESEIAKLKKPVKTTKKKED